MHMYIDDTGQSVNYKCVFYLQSFLFSQQQLIRGSLEHRALSPYFSLSNSCPGPRSIQLVTCFQTRSIRWRQSHLWGLHWWFVDQGLSHQMKEAGITLFWGPNKVLASFQVCGSSFRIWLSTSRAILTSLVSSQSEFQSRIGPIHSKVLALAKPQKMSRVGSSCLPYEHLHPNPHQQPPCSALCHLPEFVTGCRSKWLGGI